jgi:hypothetical protein
MGFNPVVILFAISQRIGDCVFICIRIWLYLQA